MTLHGVEAELVAAVERLRPSVVRIRRLDVGPDLEGSARRRGAGSGLIVDERGWLVTNDHVVREARDLRATLDDGREIPLEVVGEDPVTDIALVRADATGAPRRAARRLRDAARRSVRPGDRQLPRPPGRTDRLPRGHQRARPALAGIRLRSGGADPDGRRDQPRQQRRAARRPGRPRRRDERRDGRARPGRGLRHPVEHDPVRRRPDPEVRPGRPALARDLRLLPRRRPRPPHRPAARPRGRGGGHPARRPRGAIRSSQGRRTATARAVQLAGMRDLVGALSHLPIGGAVDVEFDRAGRSERGVLRIAEAPPPLAA